MIDHAVPADSARCAGVVRIVAADRERKRALDRESGRDWINRRFRPDRWRLPDSELVRRVLRARLEDRRKAVRANLILAGQAGMAAGLAWATAVTLLSHPQPVFAPIAAVGTIASSLGQRLRSTIELILGVSLGIALGDGLIVGIGAGPWQLGLVVFLSIVVAIALGGGPAVVTQAAATGILIAALSPSPGTLEFPRVYDALTGGLVGLAVVTLLLPLNPLRVVDRAAEPALETMCAELDATAAALRGRKPEQAEVALERMRGLEEALDGLQQALQGGQETVRLAPARWRRRRALGRYVAGARHLVYAMINIATLVRRAVFLLEQGEPVPPAMPSALTQLAEAIRLLRYDLSVGLEPEAARERALRAASEAGRAYVEGVGFSGSVVVAQVRTIASDLLQATGVARKEANQQVRRAANLHGRWD
jgi:uncharacterized membrane protein YgaE (UPF0421/DUF939 family)